MAEPARKRRVLLVVAVAGFLLVQAQVLRGYANDIRNGGPDFVALYTAAFMVADGDRDHVYDFARQWEYQRPLVAGFPQRPMLLPFIHPPHELVLLAPFGWLSYLHAYWLWYVVNLLLLALGLWAMRKHIPRVWAGLPYLVLALAGVSQLLIALYHGQNSILLLALFAFAMGAFANGRYGVAGALLAVACVKYQLAVPVALVLAVASARRKPLLAGFAAGALASAIAAFAVVGPRPVLAYPSFALAFSKLPPEYAFAVPEQMPNLRGWLVSLFGRDAAPVSIALGIAALAGLAFVLRHHGQDSPESRSLGFAAAVVAACAVSFHHNSHDQVVLLLPVLLLIERALAAESRQQLVIALAVVAALYVSGFEAFRAGWFLFLPVAALAVLCVNELWREPGSSGVRPAQA